MDRQRFYSVAISLILGLILALIFNYIINVQCIVLVNNE